MSPEERQLLSGLFDRVRENAASPRDAEAEAFIADRVRAQPYAPYLLSQAVIVQDHALNAAAERIQQLEAQVRELETRAAPAQQEGGGFLGGIGKSLFGSGETPRRSSVPSSGGASSAWTTRQPVAAQAPQPVPQQAPQSPPEQTAGGYDPFRRGGAQAPRPGFNQAGPAPGAPGAPGPWGGQQQQQGGGFLRGAMGVAAGVAGGVLLGNAIGGLMGGAKAPGSADAQSGAQPASGDSAQAPQTAENVTPAAHQDEGSFDNGGVQNASYEDPGFDMGGDFGEDI